MRNTVLDAHLRSELRTRKFICDFADDELPEHRAPLIESETAALADRLEVLRRQNPAAAFALRNAVRMPE
jgi:hypothetical protein